MGLYGGAAYLTDFVARFENTHRFYKAPRPTNPVIIIMDNDGGFDGIEGVFKGKKSNATPVPKGTGRTEYRGADFIHVVENLYVVLTPLGASGSKSEIEDLFTSITREEVVDKKTLCLDKEIDRSSQYGKDTFANKVILPKKASIDFSGFKILLDRIVLCMEHYESSVLAST